MRIGIFFGGQSREREISFAGGRTVYDNLNKSLFEAVPIFVDSLGNFILLNWQYIYKGTIRDFYPPSGTYETDSHYQYYIESIADQPRKLDSAISSIGKKLNPENFEQLIDFAFLCLHGPYGEDGNIQGLLEWYGIPYSGSGIFSSSVGINKSIQADLQLQLGMNRTKSRLLSKNDWLTEKDRQQLFRNLINEIHLPIVVKAPSQGSSIGVSIVSEDDFNLFEDAVNRSFFLHEVKASHWNSMTSDEKIRFIAKTIDIREGIGLPVYIENTLICLPEHLMSFLNDKLGGSNGSLILESIDNERFVLFESYIKGKEFSCIVIQDEDGKPIALPPTEIIKRNEVFDYRSKYLPGISRKQTPINVAPELIKQIRVECERLFETFRFNVYARIDGFLDESGKIFLNDPNTTSGMLPSSFFFHQAAEIGLNPSQFLTYIIRTSLAERIKTGKKTKLLQKLLTTLDQKIKADKSEGSGKIKVAVLMGGYSSERHISVESGRNIYEKLASSGKYRPIPVFLTGDDKNHELFLLPINVMLKDNADDILQKVKSVEVVHPMIKHIQSETELITGKYAGTTLKSPKPLSYPELQTMADFVFIALHGRPGEDGAVQKKLEEMGLPYNGSGPDSSIVTINKFETNEILKNNGVKVADHSWMLAEDWQRDAESFYQTIELRFSYPFIAKPADDGCSSAVKKLKNRAELDAYCNLLFRKKEDLIPEYANKLQLSYNEEFPRKQGVLLEAFINREDADHFLEITGGLLTHQENGRCTYEIFPPSETLATGEVLSLEEKFLAGEGQNITPARYSPNAALNREIEEIVKKELENVARILKVEGYARIDAFVRISKNKEPETIIIEVNSLPGMTPATCIFHQTGLHNYKPFEFIEKIIEYGMRNKLNTA